MSKYLPIKGKKVKGKVVPVLN